MKSEVMNTGKNGKRIGRPSAIHGRKIYPNIKENPRRANSKGRNTLQLIIDNPGITEAELIARGGRLIDVRIDIKANRVWLK